MDLGGVDVWGQIAVETSQMFVSEGGVIKSRFAGTVSDRCNLDGVSRNVWGTSLELESGTFELWNVAAVNSYWNSCF